MDALLVDFDYDGLDKIIEQVDIDSELKRQKPLVITGISNEGKTRAMQWVFNRIGENRVATHLDYDNRGNIEEESIRLLRSIEKLYLKDLEQKN